jgi:hypothetical protein
MTDLINLSDEDFEALLPGSPVALGKKTLVIRPLGLEGLKLVFTLLLTKVEDFTKMGITRDNFNKPDKIPVLAGFLMSELPEVFEMLSGLNRESFKKLPLAKVVELLTVIIQVNITSQDTLSKNLLALAKVVKPMSEALQGMTAESSAI